MTIEEIKEIRATVLPTEQEYFDAHSVEMVDTLLAEVEALTDCLNGSRKATYTAEMYDKGVAEARREGWEQGKAEAKMLSFSYRCRKDIAAMEYGGEK